MKPTGEEIGVVKTVNGSRAEVTVTPSGACTHCPAASICNWTGEKTRLVVAHNPTRARVGDTVVLRRHPAASTATALIVFGLPAVLMIIGIVIGRLIFNDLGAVVFAGIGVLLAGMLLYIIERARKKSGTSLPVIVRIEGATPELPELEEDVQTTAPPENRLPLVSFQKEKHKGGENDRSSNGIDRPDSNQYISGGEENGKKS